MKRMCAIMMAAALVAGFATTSGAVELTEDCAYVYGNPGGFDLQSTALFAVLDGLLGEDPSFPEVWEDADLETVAAFLDGDGIPDYVQLGMLGAVLCSADSKDANAILAQYDANVALFNGLVSDIGDLADAVGPMADNMETVGTALVEFADTLPAGAEKDAITDAGNLLLAYSEELGTFVSTYGPLLTTVLPAYSNWFAAMGGLSTEMQATLDSLVTDLLGELTDYVTDLQTAAAQLDALALQLEGLGQTELAGGVADLADEIEAVIPMLSGVSLPAFEIYGVFGKAAGEPFSAAGDYNGDGLTNLETWVAVQGAGGGRPEFVSAATGSDPFWPGNPALPVATGLGLALLAGACALAGARSLKK